MNIHDATEEAYKRGVEDAIKKIGKSIATHITCLKCPEFGQCSESESKPCHESIQMWMRSLFEEEKNGS